MTTTGATTSSALAPLVDALLSEPLDDLDVPGLQARIEAVTPQVFRLQGWLTTAAGQLDARTGGSVLDPDTGRPRTVAGWLAQVQHSTASAAGSQLRTARLLRSMPLVADAVLTGVLTLAQAAVLTRLVGTIDPAALTESQPQLITVAAVMDPHQLGLWVAHQIATHCEPALDADDTTAHAKRHLTHRREADGSLSGRFRIPAGDSEALLTALEPLARRAGDEDARTAAQRRADALVELAEQVLRHGTLPDAGGLRPQLSYVVPADWATAQQQQAACTARAAPTTHRLPSPTRSTRPSQVTAASVPGRRARPPPGPVRRPAAASRRCCATPGSPGCCSPRPGRSTASSRCATASPPPNAATSPPATCTASPAAAPAHRRCATPTTCAPAPTAAPPLWTTSCCCAAATTSCGTKASSSSTTSPSPGTPTSRPHHHPTRSPTCSAPDPDTAADGHARAPHLRKAARQR